VKDGQQFHQYNHISPQLIEHKKKITTYDVGNPAPGFEQAQQCGRVKPVNRIQTPPYHRDDKETCTDSLPLKNTYYHKK
jgi:hypothetical protein